MKLAVAAFVVVALLSGCGGGDSQPSVESCNTVITDPNANPDITPLKSGDSKIEFETTKGNFTVELDEKVSPCNGDSMLQLAKDGFFDGIAFHRIVPGFVIQGGDPKGDGTGGPGYSVVEAPPQDLVYEKGVVAMAKTGAEAAGTSGSQFFVVTAEDAGLPPDYALLGKVTAGQDVVDKIGVAETDPATEAPLEPVVINSVKVSEG